MNKPGSLSKEVVRSGVVVIQHVLLPILSIHICIIPERWWQNGFSGGNLKPKSATSILQAPSCRLSVAIE